MRGPRTLLVVLILLVLGLAVTGHALRDLTPPARAECQEIWMPIAEDEEQEVYVLFYVCTKRVQG